VCVCVCIKLQQAESFEHWLVMYFLKYVFCIILNPKKATDCSFKIISKQS